MINNTENLNRTALDPRQPWPFPDGEPVPIPETPIDELPDAPF